MTFHSLPDDPDDFLIVFGVNHEATGKATYSNFSIYHSEKELGLGGKNSRELAGSADDYNLGAFQNKSSYLYAFKVARNCGVQPATECLQIDEVPITERCPFGTDCPAIHFGDPLFVGFRAYVEPETGVGPYWYEILWDRAIHFMPANGTP